MFKTYDEYLNMTTEELDRLSLSNLTEQEAAFFLQCIRRFEDELNKKHIIKENINMYKCKLKDILNEIS